MTNHLGNVNRKSTVKVRASVVIQLMDGLTGQAPIEQGLTLRVQGMKRAPIKKPNGYYVLIDLEQGEYVLHIQSTNYLEESLTWSFNPATSQEESLLITLKPSSAYANPARNACVRFVVQHDLNIQDKDIQITARITEPKCSVAKLIQDYQASCSRTVNIVRTGQLYTGDLVWLMPKTNPNVEYGVISNQDDNEQSLMLQTELTNDYKRGSLFLPAMQTTINSKGEAVLFFRNYPLQAYAVTLEIKATDYLIEKEFIMKEGQVENLGIVSL